MATGQLFLRSMQALFYNYKQLPVQRMLDFDFLCGRKTPSVAGIINPGSEGFSETLFGARGDCHPSPFNAHLRPEEIEAAALPPPVGGRSIC